MNDPLAIGLLQQQMARPTDPEDLEQFGKKAAALYTTGKSLTQAVIESVKTAELAPEQLKRVCEFANNEAFLHEFEKGGSLRNVTFEGGPADPARVIQELNTGASPAVHQVDHLDYAAPTSNYKLANDALLEEAFGLSKKAHVDHNLHHNPAEDIYDAKVTMEGVRDTLITKIASSAIALETVCGDLCQSVEQSLQENSYGDVLRAWASYTDDPQMFKLANTTVQEFMKERGIITEVGMSKQAGVVNPDHPLIEQYQVFTKMASEHQRLERALDIANEQLKTINEAFRRQYDPQTR
jgi:hypothetical protein